eukprot:SAG31_NODE_205_length_20397_cov_19.191152_10_plen_110_part_00
MYLLLELAFKKNHHTLESKFYRLEKKISYSVSFLGATATARSSDHQCYFYFGSPTFAGRVSILILLAKFDRLVLLEIEPRSNDSITAATFEAGEASLMSSNVVQSSLDI